MEIGGLVAAAQALTAASAALIEIATIWFAHAMPVMVRPQPAATVAGPQPNDFGRSAHNPGAGAEPEVVKRDPTQSLARGEALINHDDGRTGGPIPPTGANAPEPEPEEDTPTDFGLASLLDELTEMAEEDDIPPPPPDEVDVWERRISTYRRTRMWMPDWGPLPGQEGCRAPAEVLR